MSIHDLAVRWASVLARELGSDQKQENRMAFGLELLLGEIVKWIVLLGLSGIMGLLREVVIMQHPQEYYAWLQWRTLQ